LRAQCQSDLERCERHTATDSPDENPVALSYGGLRDEHPVRRLEGEWERRSLLERERIVQRNELWRGNRLELAVRPVGVLADHGDPAVVRNAGVDDDALSDVEPLETVAERRHDPGAVGSEDARLRNRGEALAHPDVEVVQPCGTQRHENLAGCGHGIVDVFVAKDVGASVLVYAHGLQRGRILS
jgi:hypothetical protein